MQCKNRWERDFLIKATLKSFVNGKYHTHRSNLLLEQEKSRLPETMPLVENYLKVSDERKKKKDLKDKISALVKEVGQCKRAADECSININRYLNGEAKATEKREFKRACPVAECLGFLSTQWKCGVCNIWACPTCMEIKGEHKDDPHECNPDIVATAQLLKKDTKNCPSCAAMIYKISGCDQMWCTQCHIAFSWRSGRRINGVIHNPHFYQWQNNGGGGGNVNAPAAAVCGGFPDLYTLRAMWIQYVPKNKFYRTAAEQPVYFTHIEQCIERIEDGSIESASMDGVVAIGTVDVWNNVYALATFMMKMHRRVIHFNEVSVRNIRRKCQNISNNADLRIKYAVKEITESKLKSHVARRDKCHQKSTAILHIYELLNTVFVESFRDIVEAGALLAHGRRGLGQERGGTDTPLQVWLECILRNFKRCNQVRLYANRELVKISVMYNQSVVGLSGNFFEAPGKFTTVELKNSPLAFM